MIGSTVKYLGRVSSECKDGEFPDGKGGTVKTLSFGLAVDAVPDKEGRGQVIFVQVSVPENLWEQAREVGRKGQLLEVSGWPRLPRDYKAKRTGELKIGSGMKASAISVLAGVVS